MGRQQHDSLARQKAAVLELIRLQRLEPACIACQSICDAAPEDAANWFMLATLEDQLGRTEAAVAHYHKALERQPALVPAWFGLGNLLYRRGDLDGAEQALRKAVEFQPDFFEARANLGKLLQARLQFTAAGEQFEAALALRPDSADTCNDLGMSLNARGLTDAAEQAFRKALEIAPAFHAAASNLLLSLNYTARYTPARIFREHVRLGGSLRDPAVSGLSFAGIADPARRLRIGYLSADFRDHSVAAFCGALLKFHDRDAFGISCYADVGRPDEVTRRLQGMSDSWRDIHGLPDTGVIEMIRDDGIDVLVDLGGHTAGNRLPVFAARAAPLQVTWLGYPNTTGVPEMDFRLTDALADPPGRADDLCSESLLRLPGCFVCYTPLADVPLAARLQQAADGPVTFGSFNSYLKMTPEVFRAWAGILQAVPDSRLLIKNFSLTDPAVRAACLQRFDALGIAADRLELRGVQANKGDHLGTYGHVDIALDTFPYNGTTTTCEALWMGIPVVTLAGDLHAGRVGVSLLSTLGLERLIARDPADYVRIAVALAADRPRLERWRTELRGQMRHSPLCDGPAFCRNVETALRQLWVDWCHRR